MTVRLVALLLAACVTMPPTVQAPVTVVVQPAQNVQCSEERVLVDDALQSLLVGDGGTDG
jgi:starvation-inducible outer membrane lipoprotein